RSSHKNRKKTTNREVKNYRGNAAATRNPGGSKGEAKGGEEPHPSPQYILKEKGLYVKGEMMATAVKGL
ncbi:hypothetical protein A2U01_0105018, partial [Trifolium medium]|nr:hypothetical protein [Trifolium medium]